MVKMIRTEDFVYRLSLHGQGGHWWREVCSLAVWGIEMMLSIKSMRNKNVNPIILIKMFKNIEKWIQSDSTWVGHVLCITCCFI